MDISLIVFAAPIFSLLIGIESLFSIYSKRSLYKFNDSINNISSGILEEIGLLPMRGAILLAYYYLYTHYSILNFSANSFMSWILLWIGVDFCYYWFHRCSQRAAEESLPLRDAFAVLFFVAVGMLFDPNVLINQPLQVLLVVSIIVFGKSLAAFILVLAFRYPLSSACVISASLAQIGEFSFILAELGVRLDLLPIEGRSYILAGALISIAINPLLFKLINPIQSWVQKRKHLSWLTNPTDDSLSELPTATPEKYLAGQVVLVGYGRVGKKIAKILKSNDIPFIIVEENRELIARLRRKGVPSVYGDSTAVSTLIQAHIARASMLIIAVSAAFHVRPIIQCGRMVNPNIEILIRSHDEDEAKLLANAGPGKVFFAEEEIAKNICSYALGRFGKTLKD